MTRPLPAIEPDLAPPLIDWRWWLIIVPCGLGLGVLVAVVMALPGPPLAARAPQAVITPATRVEGTEGTRPALRRATAPSAPRTVVRTVTPTPRTAEPAPVVIVLPEPATTTAPSSTTPPSSTSSAPTSSASTSATPTSSSSATPSRAPR